MQNKRLSMCFWVVSYFIYWITIKGNMHWKRTSAAMKIPGGSPSIPFLSLLHFIPSPPVLSPPTARLKDSSFQRPLGFCISQCLLRLTKWDTLYFGKEMVLSPQKSEEADNWPEDSSEKQLGEHMNAYYLCLSLFSLIAIFLHPTRQLSVGDIQRWVPDI